MMAVNYNSACREGNIINYSKQTLIYFSEQENVYQFL